MDETVRDSVTCPSCQAKNDAGASTCSRCGHHLGDPPSTLVVTVDLRPGMLFHGRYEILGPLGRGGMGMVYRARDLTLDEVVAIKVLRPDFAQDPKMAERFKSEIKLARRIRHKNVCAIHDYGEERGLLYISMEMIEGVDLKRVLREKGPFPAEEAYDLCIQVAEGLQAVHDAGIVHRDLKTPNIIEDNTGVARLMDFGVAKRVGEGTATATGAIVGTPEYMSPEQAQGHKVDYRSDIYALGIVMYEIFTGQVPFRGETPISTILKHLNDPPPLDGPQAEGIPAGMKPVLRKCLAKDPVQRYPTARDVAEAVRQARSPSRRAQPIATAVLQAPTVRQPPGRRALRPWLLGIPLVVVAAAVLLLRNRQGVDLPLIQASPPAAAPSVEPVATRPMASSPPASPVLSPAPTSEAVVPSPTAAASLRPSPTVLPSPRATRVPTPVPTARAVAPVIPTPVVVPTVAPPTPKPEPVESGQLQVAVIPWGDVIVDGRLVGTTPLDRFPLPPGPHLLRVRHPSYEIFEVRVTIRSGATEKIVVNFPAQGTRKQD